MNILLMLTPKNKVAYINEDSTVRQALEKMEFHRYSAIPILDREGGYVGTLTEGDLLWAVKNRFNLNLKAAENIIVSSIPRNRDNLPVTIEATFGDLVEKAVNQNFIPVLDGKSSFIGIVTRKDIIQYCYNKICN
ncbi:MAG: CBS domain-containing protein [Bacilli bacterium]|nr:CBS domain-containing protein [Bacilli bacterium]MDD4077642.1 CBS domain-containing protein [Bacilli bacterium]MDD4388149.1 CBS domain-containing protein [Bacilli bacterium]